MHYREYLFEREGIETIETDFGFVHYKSDSDSMLISDMYIAKDRRGDKLSHKLADHVFLIAQERNCKNVFCQVDIRANGVEESMKTILSYGFKVYREPIQGHIILFVKEVKNG